MGVRITSWNVNGIRNPFGYQPWREKRTFEAMFDILDADIVVMQETKIQRKDLQDDMVLVPGWDVFFSLPKHKKGYAGVAIYTRNSVCMPIRAEEGITGVLCPPSSSTKFRDLPPDQQIGGYPKPGQLVGLIDDLTLDCEGRCVILEFPAFVLIGTYSPANSDGSRDDFRLGYLDALDVRIRNLVAMGKRVVLTGDLNVIRTSMDTSNLFERLRKEGISVEEFFSTPSRHLFNQLIFEGDVLGNRDENREKPVLWDLGRLFHPTREGMFTCWDTKKNTRPANVGSRIDYVLCSDNMKDWFIDSNIQEGLMGSDHCPVFATLKDVVSIDEKEVHLRDIMNPPGVFKDGVRLRDWTAKDLLPLSAKLIPEFDRRRSIKDMFSKKPVPSKSALAPINEPSESPSSSFAKIELSRDEEAAEIPTSQPESVTSAPSPAKPRTGTLKRTPSSTASTSRPQKKTKATLTKEPSSKGQSSLMGFFKPKTTASPSTIPEINEDTKTLSEVNNNFEAEMSKESNNNEELKDAIRPSSPDRVFDPIESKESWSKLLGKRVLPKCEHGEDCISVVTKKPGVNRGRSFFVCARPIGPSGEKEKGTQWRCPTFIWSSDWNGS
ncbi:DNA-(apurinic or apyrimidinic site) lyase 2 [Daldinia childiae]|uniref:DNA-(apurinic or apyrimidinic site) lyase 2 n=1 Tax=Daldinia childiae TaxID=326645 RepID=UPI00144887A3|nr:DNA-(apurinic or apyrimidinic site) lyase 2 [Daldinia childiae]KAF3055236.1 DNA-(apurinic or apyrimidinic site) lyase 2 [Daldinia childiae]